MSQLIKVMMNLTERDFENAEKITEQLRVHNKAEAVSAALSISSFLGEMLQGDKELIVRDRKGGMEKIIIPGLTGAY